MMLIKKYITIVSVSLTALFCGSCASFDDMNRNPYAVYDATADSFVQTILYKSQYTILQANYNLIPQFVQQAISTGYDSYVLMPYNYELAEADASRLWGLYVQKGNAEAMLVAAREKSDPALEAVALILRSWVMHIITDTYGDVPYHKSGLMALQDKNYEFNIPYDSQKDIYIDLFRSLEKANLLFQDEGCENFNALCDFTYGGTVSKWRKFGNSLYLRLLMRASLKVNEESDGKIDLGDEYGELDVAGKIKEIYDGFGVDDPEYPIITSVDDRMKVKFSSSDSYLYTPFYTTTSGIFNSIGACSTMVDKMIIRNEKNKVEKVDPRYFCYFTRDLGLPAQMTVADVKKYLEREITSTGRSKVGRYVSGGEYGDLKNREWYPVLNYSEILFIFAEACCRGWITGDVKSLYLDACEASMIEWNPMDLAKKDYETSRESYLAWLDSEFKTDDALNQIMTQKWISTFWLGVESWADYRRTGYPILDTNGPAAANDGVLCTRITYPSTEEYNNYKYYKESVDKWLGGKDNMKTDVWWADTQESKNIRILERK